MIEGFDKEIDALLRQAAQSETASGNSEPGRQNSELPHLDADEISLFAENALPENLRERTITHFAECDRCRKILSDLIRQNPMKEIVSGKQTEVFAPVVPWYRKMFVFPNLAYTLGALVLIFSGLAAFTILQSVENSKNAEVSQISERPQGAKGMASDGETLAVERSSDSTMSNAASNSAMSNASMSNSAASSSNAMMSNASTGSFARSSNTSQISNSATVSNKSSVSANESTKEERQVENETAKKDASNLPSQDAVINNMAEEKQKRTEDKSPAKSTKPNVSAPSSSQSEQVVAGAENNSSTSASTAKNSTNSFIPQLSAGRRRDARKSDEETAGTRQIGGKFFVRKNNVWIDTAYKNQATINITRRADDYKKLDSGLRSIAENLGGTMIIVWKDKAYRIQ